MYRHAVYWSSLLLGRPSMSFVGQKPVANMRRYNVFRNHAHELQNRWQASLSRCLEYTVFHSDVHIIQKHLCS